MSEGWAHPELLAETDWLAEHLDDPNVAIVDCDLLPAYQRLHIPNAVWGVSRYWKGEGTDSDTYAMDDPQRFGELMGRMGIDNDTQVIAYDSSGSLFAARLWWALDRFGHTNCRVLHGGLDKWCAEGRALSRENYRPATKTFAAPAPRDDNNCRLDEVVALQGDAGHVFWDTRSDGEWTGANKRGTQRGGRIPGAVHLEWLDTLDAPVRTMKPPEELRRMLAELGITPDKRVTTY